MGIVFIDPVILFCIYIFTKRYMRLFCHLIYEFKKGVRDLILYTVPADSEEKVKEKLQKNAISYVIQPLPNGNINVFFGKEECISVIRKICNKSLNRLSPEEDFMLGILLGYSLPEQCRRYCKRQEQNNPVLN
jgi:Protein of unknown function (DUF2023).